MIDKRKLKTTILDILRDLLLAFLVVLIVMLILYAYCGIWPPMVVVESGSMQHSDSTSFIGVIDTGDMVFVKEVNGCDDLVTYIDGESNNYLRYGDYGDVVVYRPDGLPDRVPIIHRLVLWLDVNDSACFNMPNKIDFENYTFDIPVLNIYGSLQDIVLHDYGYEHEEITISLVRVLDEYKRMNMTPHGGYISMGDHNAPKYDQFGSGSYEPILPEWIVGKAVGELPWFGLIKLSVLNDSQQPNIPRNSWVNLFISIILLICVPLLIDFCWPMLKKHLNKNEVLMEEDKEKNDTQEFGSDLEGRDLNNSPKDDKNIDHDQMSLDKLIEE